jgi:hypothetical protein
MAIKHILENKLYCERCGQKMLYNDMLNPLVSYQEVYQCPNMCTSVDTLEVEGKVLAAIRKNLFSMKRLVKIVEDAKLCYGDYIANISIKVFELRGQIMKVEQLVKTRKLTGFSTSDLLVKLEDLRSELEEKEKILASELNEEQLEYGTIQKFMLINLTPKEKRSLIMKYVDKIICSINGMFIHYNLDASPKKL